jgi:hypothetical protein
VQSDVEESVIHVVPHDDLIEHRPDGGRCGAFLNPEGVVVHHSADKREQLERQGVKGKGWVLKEDEFSQQQAKET